MGIDGLLRLIDPVVVREHISSFEGKTVAIDIAGWIYKGCYSCTFLHNQGQKSNNFLKYIFEMLGLLDYYKITPICVFDGRYVGGKEGTV
jgi:5'-3' exonuclease